MYLLVLIIIILCIILFSLNGKERLIKPWELEKCKLTCIQQGQELPWQGGRIPWRNADIAENATFDVAGCLRNCELATWYPF